MTWRPRSTRGAQALLRTVAAVAVVVAGLTMIAPGARAQDGPAPDGPAQGGGGNEENPAIGDLVGCVQGSNRLIAVFLMDESQSLQFTDPDNRRVDAAKAALDGLGSLAERSSDTQVDVTFAAFANRYRPVGDWTPITPKTAPVLAKTADSFKRRDNGIDTDFVTALSGARGALAARSAVITEAGDPAPCKAVFFFTDGEFDIQVRTPETVERLGRTKPYARDIPLDSDANVTKAESVGRDVLCRDGGLIDGIRRDDVTLLSVALAKDPSSPSQRFLASVSRGGSDPDACGAPVGSPAGAYLNAADADTLVARFDEVAARVAGGTLIPGSTSVELCDADPCDAGTRKVVLDPSVRKMRILALAPQPGLAVEITGPNGSTTVTEAGTTSVGPVTVSATSVAGRGLGLELDRPPEDLAAWTGEWSVALVDPSGDQAGDRATLQIYLFSDFGVSLDDADLTRGKTAKLTASIVVPEGIDPKELLEKASATVRLDDPIGSASATVELDGPPVGPFAGTFEVPADYTISSYSASVELQATTKNGGSIVVRSAPTSLTVRRPEGSVQLAPAVLDMPTLTGEGSTSADLVLEGGKAPGCVWFEAGPTSAPREAGELEVTVDGRDGIDENSCIAVAPGESLTVPVAVSPAARATGAVRGAVYISTKVEGQKANVTQVPYQFDLSAGIDQVRRLAYAIGLLALGLAVPMGLLLLINAASARFQSLDVVKGAVVPVLVAGDQLFRTDGPRPMRLSLRQKDFGSLKGTGEKRRFAFGGIQFRATASRNPFGSTAARAAPEGGAEKLKGRAGSRVELDPGLAGSWIFLLDPDRTRRAGKGNAEGDLIAFLAEGDARDQLDRMQRDVDGRLHRTASELAGLVRRKRRSRRSSKVIKPSAETNVDEPTADEPTADEPNDEPTVEPANDEPTDPAVEPVEPTNDEPVEQVEGDTDATPSTPTGFTGGWAGPDNEPDADEGPEPGG